MEDEHLSATSHRLVRLARKFRNKEYRDAYVAANVRQFIAKQMRAFRGDRSQAEFGRILEQTQSVVSRYEDPSYGKWSFQTLLDVASKLNVAVVVKFVSFDDFLVESENVSNDALAPQPYEQERVEKAALNYATPLHFTSSHYTGFVTMGVCGTTTTGSIYVGRAINTISAGGASGNVITTSSNTQYTFANAEEEDDDRNSALTRPRGAPDAARAWLQ